MVWAMLVVADGAFDEYNLERLKAAGKVLLGARSYEMFRDFWPQVETDTSASAATPPRT